MDEQEPRIILYFVADADSISGVVRAGGVERPVQGWLEAISAVEELRAQLRPQQQDAVERVARAPPRPDSSAPAA